ncbi:GIGYF2 isoform 26, partial [Pan troglodytes]
MAAETQTLNFGPEWLRALSSGGSITSPPLSPALPKYKLADYRYGRGECGFYQRSFDEVEGVFGRGGGR